MAMRYYEGQTFKNVVKDNPGMVDEAWLKRILKPILEALDTLYKANILHRDISPENIMIQPNGEAVLLDFGAARQIVTGLTKSLTVILKPGYAPVEQYADDDSMQQGPWTDIYSLSAVMYAAIAKKAPPTAVTRMLTDPIESLQAGDYPGFDKKFLAAIDKGLVVRPEGRPQSIAEFARLLGIDMSVPSHAEAVVRPFPPSPAPAPAPARQQATEGPRRVQDATPAAAPQAAPKKKNAVWLYAAGGVVLAAVAGVWFITRHGAAPVTPPVPAEVPVIAAAPKTSEPKEEVIPWETLNKDHAASASAAAPSAEAPKVPKANESPPPKPTEHKKAKAADTAAHQAASAHAKTAENEAVKPIGSLALAIRPWGSVFVDGDPKGVSPPLKRLSLPEGRHQIKIINPHFPEYVVNVTVGAGKSTTISRDFAGSTP
jgi:hypothetical protein